MSQVLLVVDVQHCFLNAFTSHVPARIRRLLERDEYDLVWFTRFVNTEARPYRHILGWHGGSEPPATELAPERVLLAGIDTDMCVLKNAMDGFDLGLRPIVLVDCCASTAGLQAHLAGLAVLARNIGADQLQEAGLSEGYLGPPRRRREVRGESKMNTAPGHGVQNGIQEPQSDRASPVKRT